MQPSWGYTNVTGPLFWNEYDTSALPDTLIAGLIPVRYAVPAKNYLVELT